MYRTSYHDHKFCTNSFLLFTKICGENNNNDNKRFEFGRSVFHARYVVYNARCAYICLLLTRDDYLTDRIIQSSSFCYLTILSTVPSHNKFLIYSFNLEILFYVQYILQKNLIVIHYVCLSEGFEGIHKNAFKMNKIPNFLKRNSMEEKKSKQSDVKPVS